MKNQILNVSLLSLAFVVATGAFSAAKAFTFVQNNRDLILIGKLQEKITTANGFTSGVTVSGTQATGDINYTLDTSKDSFFEYDFDNGTIAEQLHLLATFQLQADLNQPPVKITIIESGTIIKATQTPAQPGDIGAVVTSSGFITPPNSSALSSSGSWTGSALQPTLAPGDTRTPFAFTIQSKLNGGGIVQEGLFTGFTWNNFQDKTNTNVQVGKNKNTQGKEDPEDPNNPFFPPPGGNGQPPDEVPEPLTILGSMAALGFGAYAERKRKASNSSEEDNTKDS